MRDLVNSILTGNLDSASTLFQQEMRTRSVSRIDHIKQTSPIVSAAQESFSVFKTSVLESGAWSNLTPENSYGSFPNSRCVVCPITGKRLDRRSSADSIKAKFVAMKGQWTSTVMSQLKDSDRLMKAMYRLSTGEVS